MAAPRIFVSHSHQDNDWCSQLVDALTLAGFDVWFDKQGLYVGDQWISKLETELESRDVFLVVLTPKSWTSPWVRREVQLAIHSNKRIIGVKHRPVELSGFITTYQILDAMGQDPQRIAQQISASLGGGTPVASSVALAPTREPRTDGVYLAALGADQSNYHCLRFRAVTVEMAGGDREDHSFAAIAASLAKWSQSTPAYPFTITGDRLAFTSMRNTYRPKRLS